MFLSPHRRSTLDLLPFFSATKATLSDQNFDETILWRKAFFSFGEKVGGGKTFRFIFE